MSLSREELFEYLTQKSKEPFEGDILDVHTDALTYMMDNCQITIPENNRFFVDVNCHGLGAELTWFRADVITEEILCDDALEAHKDLVYTGTFDISHTNPVWESILSLGFSGLKERVTNYRDKCPADDAKKIRFYSCVIKFYDAMERFLVRASKCAENAGKTEMAIGLMNLTKRAPQNLFEAMQISIAYYVFHHTFEGTYLRAMGRTDSLFYPYYKNENKEFAKELLYDYFAEADRLNAPANIPFSLGGTNEKGESLVNELTYEIVDTYINSNLTNTKFHLMCSKNIPESIVSRCFEAVQNGKNSIVFLGDETIIASLLKMGADKKDAANYHIVGCYEAGSEEELTCTCNARISLPKVLELTLNGGRDMLTGYLHGIETDSEFDTFDELMDGFKKQLGYLCDCAMKLTDKYESRYKEYHCAPLFSSTYLSALEKGGDLYCDYSAKYNNSSMNALGIGTVTDSLAAIKKLVYDDKKMSLKELVEILKNNWEGQEALRLFIKNKYPKFGTGNESVDKIASDVTDYLWSIVSGKPNVKGGQWRIGLLSIDWRWSFGKKCGASADGRLCGETISQNTSATFGAAKEGATAHLTSVSAIDSTKIPNGSIADIDLHISAVKGEAGNKLLCAMLKTFFDKGGFGVHFNILNTDVLKQAKENPEAYPDLQVRLCGWNVLFSTLSDKEKEEFIARSSI